MNFSTSSPPLNIPPTERLILALDLPNFKKAIEFVDELGDTVCFYKIGLELFLSGEGFAIWDDLNIRGKKVFVDFKLLDIPETIQRALNSLDQSKRNAEFLSLHAQLLPKTLTSPPNTKLLAVSVLTSVSEKELQKELGSITIQELVLFRSQEAIKKGFSGIVCSGWEVKRLKNEIQKPFIAVCPGIRDDLLQKDDQNRSVHLESAFLNGADYIVVGRPIRDAENPRAKAEEFQERIVKLFSKDDFQ